MGTEVEIYCRKCSYNLRGLPENRCPECGRPFDPQNPRTFRRRPRRALWVWVRRAMIVLLMPVMLWGGTLGWLWWGWHREQEAIEELDRSNLLVKISAGRLELPVIARLLPEQCHYLLDRVESVDLSDQTTNQDVARIARFSQLVELTIEGENVTDEGLAVLAKLRNLRSVILWSSAIRGPGLRHLSGLPQLVYLGLESYGRKVDFDGRSLVHLAPLGNLRYLSVGDRQLRDDDLAPLAGLTSLEDLSLINTGISEEGLVHVRGLCRLEKLRLGGVVLKDRGAGYLAELSSLAFLSIEVDSLWFGEAGIAHLQQLGKLRNVDLILCQRSSGLSPTDIQRAFPLARIQYHGAPLTTWPTTLPASAGPATAPAPPR